MGHSGRAKCSTCHQFFETDRALLKHNEAKHTNSFLCSDCGKNCKRKSDFKRHIAIAHGKGCQNIKTCPIQNCNQKFVTEKRYKDHINRHMGLKTHACTSCSKLFYSSEYAKEHTKMCAKLSGFSCHICGVTFNFRAALMAHVKSVHEGTLHYCECGRRYKHASSLSRHKLLCSKNNSNATA